MVTDDMKAAGWMEHDGSHCPMPNRGAVEVLLRNGRISMSRFGFWFWPWWSETNIDIVGYRPDEPDEERLAA